MYPDSSSQALQPVMAGGQGEASAASALACFPADRHTPMVLELSPMTSLVQWHLMWLLLTLWRQLPGSLQRFSTAAPSLGLLAVVIEGCFGHASAHFQCNAIVAGRGHDPASSKSLSSALFCHFVLICFLIPLICSELDIGK